LISGKPILSHEDFIEIDKDYEAAADAINLIYVNDKDDGIIRTKKGKSFIYFYKGDQVKDEKEIERIKKLVIPPAWTNVWISKSPNGHIQATGYDVAGRKQYRYHSKWSELQQETKFHRIYEFGKSLPKLRKRLQEDLAQSGFPETKVLAMAVSLMERTFIRVGNDDYEKKYGSYGLTTLKNKHVDVKGDTITFSFKGKKGVYHKITLKNKKFAKIIRQCKAIPGRELFQYYDQSGEIRKIDSGQVNQYIKNCLKQEFTTKDFRTWAGTLMMLQIFKSADPCEKLKDLQKNIIEGFKLVSQRLGNTVAVCKKYYVHPELITLYQANELTHYFEKHPEKKDTLAELSSDEQLLMTILKAIQKEKVNPKLTTRLLRKSIRRQRSAMPAKNRAAMKSQRHHKDE
jgi:DNA topoisomerase-1